MNRILLVLGMVLNVINAQYIQYDEFINKIHDNSGEVIIQEGIVKSTEFEGKAAKSWDSPYIEISPSISKKENNKITADSQIMLMISPKMPWLNKAIKENYRTKVDKNRQTLQLQKNIVEIAAKKTYLIYLIYEEQKQIYKDKEELAKNALNIAQVRFKDHRISQAELLKFKSNYSNSLTALKAHEILLDNTLNKLRVLISDPHFTGISDINFHYVNNIDLDNVSRNSIYTKIIDLEAKDYQQSAKVIGMSRFDVQFGAGYTIGQNSIDMKVIFPIPITNKVVNEKKSILELQAASIKANSINQEQIKYRADLYKKQLLEQQKLIELYKENEDNEKKLFNIIQKGFDAGAISVFEYLNVQENYLNARIDTTREKLNYIDILSSLEESIGEPIIIKEGR